MSSVDTMSDELAAYRRSGYWFHITLPVALDSIRAHGLETGHTYTDEQLFEVYYPDREPGRVVRVRESAEEIVERVRPSLYPGETAPRRDSCVSVWPDCELAFDMRSAVLGDAHPFGVVVVDPEMLDGARFVLSEYQLIAQVMVNRQMQLAGSESESEDGADGVSNDEVVTPAVQYWRAASVTNTPVSVSERSPLFEIPEVLIGGGVPVDAIVDVFEHPPVPFEQDDTDAPPEL